MKLSLKGLTLAGGTIWALSILVIGILNIMSPEYGGEFLRKMATVYPGYKASGKLIDLIVGMLYAFLVGAIWGLILGVLYNAFAGKSMGKSMGRSCRTCLAWLGSRRDRVLFFALKS